MLKLSKPRHSGVTTARWCVDRLSRGNAPNDLPIEWRLSNTSSKGSLGVSHISLFCFGGASVDNDRRNRNSDRTELSRQYAVSTENTHCSALRLAPLIRVPSRTFSSLFACCAMRSDNHESWSASGCVGAMGNLASARASSAKNCASGNLLMCRRENFQNGLLKRTRAGARASLSLREPFPEFLRSTSVQMEIVARQ